MIIDAHTHLFAEDVRRNRRLFCRREKRFRIIYEDERSRMATPQDLLGSMDRDGVEQSIICGFPWEDPALCRAGNDYLLDCARTYPKRLIPFACLPLSTAPLAEKELDRCLSRGFRGIGEMAFYNGGMTPRERKRLSSVLRTLSGQSIPFLLHTNEPVGHHYPGKSLKDLGLIYQLLLDLPDVPLILAHWGGGFLFYELMPEVARAARNVFYDTAASPFLYDLRIYRIALKIVGPQRILFGSDYPLIAPARYFAELDRIRLPGHVRAKIEGENVQSLLLKGTTRKPETEARAHE